MLRKRGRAVECTGLENRQGRESFVSSNLTASANYILLAILAIQNKKISININNMHKVYRVCAIHYDLAHECICKKIKGVECEPLRTKCPIDTRSSYSYCLLASFNNPVHIRYRR